MSTISLDDRLADRKRSRIRRWLIAAAAVALLIGLGVSAWFSPVLALTDVEVTGTELTDPAAVQETVQSRWAGTPLPQIRLGELEHDLAADFPKIETADVRWSGPRSLHVAVTDRRPVLAVPEAGGWDRYDAAGQIIDQVDAMPDDLPVLALEAVADVPAAVAAGVEFMAQVPAEQQAHITSMSAGSPGDLRLLYDHDGTEVTVMFGTPQEVARKFDVALALINTGAQEVDVSVPEVPVTR